MRKLATMTQATGPLHRFTLLASVTDAAALHAAAVENCVERKMEPGEIEDAIGSESEPDIGGCITMLLDPLEPLPGVQIEASGSCPEDRPSAASSREAQPGPDQKAKAVTSAFAREEDEQSVPTITVDTIMGPRLYPAPGMALPDATARTAWVRLLGVHRNLCADRYRLKRDRAADEAVAACLAVLLANAAGMASPYWTDEATRLCRLMRHS